MTATLTLLGTGGPFKGPSLKRMSSGYVVRTGDDMIVVDHGPGAYHRLLECGITADCVTCLLLTHLHYDHCGDVSRLLLNRWHWGKGRLAPLRIFGPPGTARFIDRLFGPDGAFSADIGARIANPEGLDPGLRWPAADVSELGAASAVDAASWRLRVVEVPHLQPHLTCYGYRIDTKEGSIVFSGDCAPCRALEDLAGDADVLVHVVGLVSGERLLAEGKFARHSAATRPGTPPAPASTPPSLAPEHLARAIAVAELGRDARVKTLVASHFTREIDEPVHRAAAIAAMTGVYGGRFVWGEDLMEIAIRDGAFGPTVTVP